MDQEILNFLLQFVSENKRNKFDLVLSQRTRYITVVLEDIFQPHNASAVVRTCDCFGIQDLHILENKNTYKVNPDVTLGSAKWVNLIRYSGKEGNTRDCISGLREKGYKIWATTPHEGNINLEELPLDSKIALLFGKEDEGLSEEALSMADGFVKIPMVGFTESLNISVCAAIFLHYLTLKLRNMDRNWELSQQEKLEIKSDWVKKVVTRADLLVSEYLKKKGAIPDVD